MSQHDFNIANQTASNARVDINNAFVALASNSSGATAPATTYANMFWYDTATNILKLRNEANSAWINVAYINQGSGEVQPYIGGTKVTDFLDQDTMSSNSSTALASQQSIKAYVDTQVAEAQPTLFNLGLCAAGGVKRLYDNKSYLVESTTYTTTKSFKLYQSGSFRMYFLLNGRQAGFGQVSNATCRVLVNGGAAYTSPSVGLDQTELNGTVSINSGDLVEVQVKGSLSAGAQIAEITLADNGSSALFPLGTWDTVAN